MLQREGTGRNKSEVIDEMQYIAQQGRMEHVETCEMTHVLDML